MKNPAFEIHFSVKGPKKSAQRAAARRGIAARKCRELSPTRRVASGAGKETVCEAPCSNLNKVMGWYSEKWLVKKGRGHVPGTLLHFNPAKCSSIRPEGYLGISVGETDIDSFRKRWPASGLSSLRRLFVEFDKRNGDLVDMNCNNNKSCERFDGPALAALTHDVQCFAEKTLEIDTGRCDPRREWNLLGKTRKR